MLGGRLLSAVEQTFEEHLRQGWQYSQVTQHCRTCCRGWLEHLKGGDRSEDLTLERETGVEPPTPSASLRAGSLLGEYGFAKKSIDAGRGLAYELNVGGPAA